MRKFFNIFLISLMVFSLFANFALAEDIKTIDFNKSVKNFTYSIDGKQTTDQILISKLSNKDLDRNNDNLKITFIQNNLLNTIKVEDNINTKGGIFYIPYETCLKLLGDAPYGINDQRYEPKLIEIDHVNYYQFDIGHFSTVDITDWFDSNYASRLSVTFNTDAQGYSDDWDNGISSIYLTSSALLDGDDDADDIKIVALDNNAGSPEICSYDAFIWDTANDKAYINFKHWINESVDTVVYIYYDYTGVGDPDNDAPSAVYTNGFMGYHFEETNGSLSDVTGNSRTLYPISSKEPDTVSTGTIAGNGYDFDGNEGFRWANSSYADVTLGSTYTIMFFGTLDTDNRSLLYQINSTYDNLCYFYNSKIYSKVGNSLTSGDSYSKPSSTFVTLVRSGTNMKYYRDGAYVSDDTVSSSSSVVDNMGYYYNNGSSNFAWDGVIDEFFIFSDAKSANFIEHFYKCLNDATSDYYTFGTVSSIPTFVITESPTNTTYSSPSSLDINVSITNNASVTFEEANFSYYDGSWHIIKNRVLSGDADTKSWSSSKISWTWDDTNSFPTENLSDIKVKACLYDGSIWYDCAESATFSLSFGEVPDISISNETEFYNMSFLDEDPDFTWDFLENFEYDLQINTSDYWDGALIYDESGITETETVTTLDNYTTYYARARGYNDVNATPYYTDWSDVKTFKTAFPPVITSPLNNSVITNNLNVPIEFIWESSGYIEISDDDFVTADYNNTFYLDDDIPLLENNKEYKIRVKSLVIGYEEGGSPSYTTNWSEIITITTNLKPVIVYPEDAETIIDTQDIELDWDPLGTAEGGSFLWYIDIAKDANFTDINASYNAIDYQPTVTLNNGTWYWRIKGYENVDFYYSNYSDTAEFIVDYSETQCDENLEFTYPDYNATFPTNAVGIIWSEVGNASMYYVKIADNALMDDAITYGLSGNNLNLNLSAGTYYLDLRVKYLDDTYSQWLSICDQLHRFNVENPSIDAPTWVLPSTATVEEGLITFSWSEVADADRYWVQFYDNSTFDPDDLDDPALIDQRVPTVNSIQLTLDSGFYWIVVKTEVDGSYSNWSSTKQLTVTVDGEIPTFDPEAKPTWITPEEAYLESETIAYSWSSVVGATGYDIQISTSPTFSSYVLNTSTSNTYYTAYLNTSDEYYTRVRAKDPYYNGAWSLTKYFELVIEEVEYIYVPNTVNLYGGDTLVYEFVGMEPDTTYTFKINSLDNDGQFFQNVATKIITSDGDGDGSFTHVFSGSAFYPFEVRDNSNNYRLLTHFVAPRPTHLYLNADHRLDVNGSIISVAVGDVAYNTQSGILHDPYQPTQSLYEYGDYLLIHYSIPDPEDAIYGIVIKNIATGANVGIIASDDLYTFNRELGYAKRNFIVVSTNGVKPYIIDQWVELDDYTGDDWHYFNFDKGAYDYALLELDGDNTVIGESVILIGDDNIAEWALTVASATVEENSNQTFNFTVNTSEIWDAYNYMYFLDKSSGLFKIGSSSAYVKHPFSYQSSFTLTYPVTTELYDDGAGRWGIRPYRYNFNADLEGVYYEYTLERSFNITPITDATTAIGEFLTLVGLGTPEGKLLFSLVGVIIGIVAVVLLGVPVGLAGLIGLIILAIFTALGFVPIWTIIIIGLGLFLLLLRTFLSGGGGE